MKSVAKSGLVAIALAAILSPPAYAQHHGGGHGHGGGWGWGGFALGAAVTGLAIESAYLASRPYPYYYPYPYPYAAPAPIYVQPTYAQPAYVQPPQQLMAAPAPATNMWYYCRKSKAYYPYVKTCAAGWEQVPATPPGY